MNQIQIQRGPDEIILELGGGDAPLVHPRCMGGPDVNVDVRMCHNAAGQQTTDFTCDLSEPLPIGSDEFDAVVSKFCLEHISYRKTRQAIGEMFRVLKPGGRVIVIVPNTEKQIEWIQNHPEGWDGRDFFDSASGKLLGDQDYNANAHQSYWSPTIAHQLFQHAGFENIVTQPFGARDTDLILEGNKPKDAKPSPPPQINVPPEIVKDNMEFAHIKEQKMLEAVREAQSIGPLIEYKPVDRAAPYNRKYLDPYTNTKGFYHDFAYHHIVAKNVAARKPGSVLELGCSRGYVLKKLVYDYGVPCKGLDISKHAYQTRVCGGIAQWDVCETPWPSFTEDRLGPRLDEKFDLCF